MRRFTFLAVPLLVACGSELTPVNATLEVSSSTITATVTRSGAWDMVSFVVPLRLHNRGSTPLRFAACPHYFVEYQVNGGWRDAFGGSCVSFPMQQPELKPGETAQHDLVVSVPLSGPAYPQWNPPTVAGTFRLAVPIVPIPPWRGRNPVDSYRPPTLYSNEFQLLDGREQ